MIFNWRAFLRQNGIQFSEYGESKNVARGNINIHCPFCGGADRSDHLGISLEHGYWGCWRNDLHRGKRPERLIVALTGCTWDEATKLFGEGAVDDIGLEAMKVKLTQERSASLQRLKLDKVQLPKEFFPATVKGGAIYKRFHNYMRSRGFPPDEVFSWYNLYGSMSGDFAHRLIFPFIIHGVLVGWTGRAITDTKMRYKTYPPGSSVTNRILYNHDEAARTGGEILAICEGPMDTLKIDFFGKDHGIRAVGLLGSHLSDQRVAHILKLSSRFDATAVLLDADATSKALEFKSRLSAAHNPWIVQLPFSVKDPGDLTPEQVVPLFDTVRNSLRSPAGRLI